MIAEPAMQVLAINVMKVRRAPEFITRAEQAIPLKTARPIYGPGAYEVYLRHVMMCLIEMLQGILNPKPNINMP